MTARAAFCGLSTEVCGMSISDTKAWANEMFGECELGDKRRTKRLLEVAELVAENPAASFPDQFEEWKDLKAAYRLFDSEKVTFEGIAAPHWRQTRRQASGRTLVLCDTTELDFGGRRKITGVGPTGNGSGLGFLLHNAMMVDAQSGSVIGIGGQTIHHRPKKRHSRKKENAAQRLKRNNRESLVWGRVIDDIGEPGEGVEYVYVCDRGADNFEVFCRLQQNNSAWVIRAKAKNRKLLTVDGESITLGKQLDKLTFRGAYELSLRARPDQSARTAEIEVSSGEMLIPVPRHTSPWVRSINPEPVRVNIVLVREVNAPKGVTPIEWVLYTSLPTTTYADAWTLIEYYETRWLIEEYHKALKTGTRVTKRQLKDGGRLEAMTGLMSVMGLRLLQLKSLARTDPKRPARTVVPMLWLQMLKAVRKRLTRVHDMTVYEFYREVAKLGGFLGRKSDGEPGWITIWRGWEKLNNLVKGATIAIEYQLDICG
jgi:hypothetical protein